MITIEIPIRELHARTGHFVRLASRELEVVITQNGKPVARITPLPAPERPVEPLAKRRKLIPSYQKALSSGKLRSAKDSTPDLGETGALRNL
jgi:prevent-host-death family protein